MTDQEHQPVDLTPYRGPAGGQGSIKSVAEILAREKTLVETGALMLKQNKPHGFMCVSCAWAKPGKPHTFEYCENGAKATAWELTPQVIDDAFFAAHSVSELRTWSDYRLEEAGRLTKPMRYDRASDHYVPVAWEEAIAAIGARLKTMNPEKVVLYSSGRTSLEASYMYALFGRIYGTNNFPDSSNMCHESTSVALPESIGQPVGTVALDDFEHCDLIFFFGQNVGSNAPRMLHQLQEARRRGCEIITFNPLRERGLERFANPQNPIELVLDKGEIISTQYLQVKCGGDIAAIYGLCKAILAADDPSGKRTVDATFVGEHTSGFEDFCASVRAYGWAELERASGLARTDLERAAAAYMRSTAAIGIYGMGLTQHRKGVEACQMVANLLLLRGNIGKPGAGICPVRGHSNVQGQRTVGITEKPAMVPYDKLRALYHFEPPEKTGLNTVEVCEKMLEGEIEAFIGLGGNFVRAVPETELVEAAWRDVPLSVEISTKLNRSHLIFGDDAYILPTLGRIEKDQAGDRTPGRLDRGFDRARAWLEGRAQADLRTPAFGAVDRRRARRDDAAARQGQGRLEGLGRRLCTGARRDRRDLPEGFLGLQRAAVHAGRLPAQAGGARAQVEHEERQGDFHRAGGARRGSRRGEARRRAATHHAALERPVQHHDLRLRRSLPRHQGHADDPAHQRARHRPLRSHGGRRGDAVGVHARQCRARGGRAAGARIFDPRRLRRRLLPRVQPADPAVAPRRALEGAGREVGAGGDPDRIGRDRAAAVAARHSRAPKANPESVIFGGSGEVHRFRISASLRPE